MKKILTLIILLLSIQLSYADNCTNNQISNIIKGKTTDNYINIINPILRFIKKNNYSSGSKHLNIGLNKLEYIKIGDKKTYFSNNGSTNIKINVPIISSRINISMISQPNVGIIIYARYIDSKSGKEYDILQYKLETFKPGVFHKNNASYLFDSASTFNFYPKQQVKNFNGGYLYIEIYKVPSFSGYNVNNQDLSIVSSTIYQETQSFDNWIKNTKFHPITKLPLTYVEKINYETLPTTACGGKITGYFTPAEYSSDGSYLHFDSIEDYPDNGILIKGNSIKTCKQNIENKNYNLGNKKNKIINIGENIVKKYDSIKLKKILSVLDKFDGENGIISLLRDYFSCKVI